MDDVNLVIRYLFLLSTLLLRSYNFSVVLPFLFSDASDSLMYAFCRVILGRQTLPTVRRLLRFVHTNPIVSHSTTTEVDIA